MAQYFDAHLHFANRGSRWLMLRLPVGVLDLETAADLLAVAGSTSPELATPTPRLAEFRRWITGPPTTDKDAILGWLVTVADRQLREYDIAVQLTAGPSSGRPNCRRR